MSMYNLIEYNKNYSKIFSSLSNWYKDISANAITNSESFKYNANIAGKKTHNENIKKLNFVFHRIILVIFREHWICYLLIARYLCFWLGLKPV